MMGNLFQAISERRFTMNKIENTLESREVAEMVGKEHSKLLRDIRRYIAQMGEAKIGFTDFFTESSYQTEQGKVLPCYKISKKGCEFIANKLTGRKGTEFTARYINRFHEMEEQLKRDSQSKKPWYIREFRRENIILYRDFEQLTGINPAIYGYYRRPKHRRMIGGVDYNGWGWKCDKEKFYKEYGFDYGDDKCMMYLTMAGLQKVLRLICEECDPKECRIAQNIIEELRSINSKKREKKKKSESQPVQISITINGGSMSDVNAITTALANL